jgi:hypothetical protein
VNTNGFCQGAPSDLFQAAGHGGQKLCTVIPSLGLVATGVGVWNHPSTEAISLLIEAAAAGTPISPTSWSAIKARYAAP